MTSENKRHAVVAAILIVAVLLFMWRRKRQAAAALQAAASSPVSATTATTGLPTPTSIPDAADPLGVAFRYITGAPLRGRTLAPSTLTPGQVADLKGSVNDTVIVAPAAPAPRPGSLAAATSPWQAVSGLLTGVFG